jgi:hypothetical protein
LSMQRHPCHCQDGRLPCNKGTAALDPRRCCRPRCDCVIAILKLALLPSSQWCCHHHQCHRPCCLLASWHCRCVCAGVFAGVAMANVSLILMASLPLLMRRRVSAVVELVLSSLPLVVKLVSSPMLRWHCSHQCAGFLPLSQLQFFALMTMALLPLSMCRRPCCCQDGVVSLVTMASMPLIRNGVVALIAMALLLSSSWHHCPAFHCRRLHK